MQPNLSNSVLILQDSPHEDIWGQFTTEALRVVLPIAQIAHCSLAGLPHLDKPLWWNQSESCKCSHSGVVPSDCPFMAERSCERVALHMEGRRLGEVLVCTAVQDKRAASAVVDMLRGVLKVIELERSEEALLQELSRCLESLEAVSEISSSTRTLDDTQALLDRIINRAVSIQTGLEGVLWLRRDEMLEPATIKTKRVCTKRSVLKGIVGKAVREHKGIIINGAERLAAMADLEPEFAQAKGVMIAPITTQQGLEGALAIWHDAPHVPFDSRTMHLAQTLAVQAAMIVENDRLHREALANELLRQEVEIGSKLQQTLLTCQPPMGLQGLQVSALTISAKEIGGDFYDFFYHSGGSLDVVIGDVMGKGVPAALVGAGTKNQIMRALCFLLTYRGDRMPKIQEILAMANREIAKQLMDLDRFVTLCYARFDSTRRNLILVDCGHTRTVHYRFATRTVHLLQGDNCPLGFRPKEVFQELVVPLEVGDILFFYSDGLTESANGSGELFGEEGIVRILRENSHLDPASLIELLRAASATFSGSDSFRDDLTCVAVKISGGKTRLTPLHHAELRIASDLQSLSIVRTFLTRLAAALPDNACSPVSLSNFILAVNEAASNVMRHAYGGKAGLPLRLIGDIYDDYLQLELRHYGRAFQPRAGQVQDFDGPAEGGMGLFIIEQFSDGVNYYTDEGGENCVRLVKQLASTQSQGAAR